LAGKQNNPVVVHGACIFMRNCIMVLHKTPGVEKCDATKVS